MNLIAVHKIIRSNDGVRESVLPGASFTATAEEGNRYLDAGAARKPHKTVDTQPPAPAAGEDENENAGTGTKETFEDRLVAAIGTLDEDNADHWTEDGKPEVSALKAALDGAKVSAKQRDAAFARFEEENPAADEDEV